MSAIEILANRFIKVKINSASYARGVKAISSSILEEASEIYNDADRTIFLKYILDAVSDKKEEHYKVCPNHADCSELDNLDILLYLINQELVSIGLYSSEDSFSKEEENQILRTLEDLQEKMSTLSDGQRILFEAFEELKDSFVFGKKRWKYLWLGKLSEMTLSGLISQTISKEIYDRLNEGIQMLTQ